MPLLAAEEDVGGLLPQQCEDGAAQEEHPPKAHDTLRTPPATTSLAPEHEDGAVCCSLGSVVPLTNRRAITQELYALAKGTLHLLW